MESTVIGSPSKLSDRRLHIPLNENLSNLKTESGSLLVDQKISDQLIRKILAEDQGKDALLISWSANKLTKNGDNFICNLTKIKVLAIVNGENEFFSYVIKTTPPATKDKFNEFRNVSMNKEISFYKELAPLMNAELALCGEPNLRIPRYIYSTSEILVLENLKEKGYVMRNFEDGLSKEHVKLIIEELARFHGAAFRLNKSLSNENLLDKFPYLRDGWLEQGTTLREPFDWLFKKSLLNCANISKTINNDLMSEWLTEMSEKCLDIIQLNTKCDDKFLTLCHGDTWNNNFLFRQV